MAGVEVSRWVRRATRQEVSNEILGRRGVMMACNMINLTSDLPITPDLVYLTLLHLYRKTPNLSVCLGDKDDARCFNKMSSENIDFQVVTERSVEEVREELHTYQYNISHGPLWCARFIPAPNPDYVPARFSSFCDLHADFPHCYHMLFGFHPSLGDGNTYKKINGAFITILDCILSETPINDNKQLGKFEANEEFNTLMLRYETQIINDPTLKQKYIDNSVKGQPEKSLLNEILPPPGGHDRKTLPVTQTFDCGTTSKFIQRSTAEGITLSSSFTLICNVALGDLLYDEGIEQDVYAISNAHHIDTRHFWDAETASDYLGCSINISNRHYIEIPPLMKSEEFWQLARRVHQDMYNLLTSDDVLKMLAFVNVSSRNSEPHTDRNLTFENLGDLSDLFGDMSHVRVTQMVNTTSIHRQDNTVWQHIICTLSGRLIHTLSYNSGLINKKLVSQYMDHISRRVQEVISLD